MSPFLLLSLVAGALAVDDRAGWQSLLGQPIFAALLVGAFTGQLEVALATGLVLELIWLSILPMRGMKRPNHVAGAIVGAGTAALVAKYTADPRVLFIASVGVFAGLVAGELGARVLSPLYTVKNRFLGQIDFEDASRNSVARRIMSLQAGSILFIFVIEALLVLALLPLAFNFAERFTRLVEGAFVDGAMYWGYLMPALGIASVIHLYWQQHLKRVLVLTAVLVVLVLWLR